MSVPAGDFFLDTESTSPVTFISGGVGITPMFSMYETSANTTPERQVAFLHSARSRKHQAFDERLTSINAELPASTYKVLYSEEGDGIFTPQFLAENIIEGSDIVCGPVGFMQFVLSELNKMGNPAEKVHYEFFI